MMVIYNTEYKTECNGVTFQNNGGLRVQKYKDISNDENNVFFIKPIETLLGEYQICDMTKLSGAFDKSVFDGNTIILKRSEDYGRHRYIYWW